MPGVAAALLGLCALALCGPPARSQIMVTNSPPEDLDGSGDDDDGFSGSGLGALTEKPLLAVSILPRKMPVFTPTLTTAPTTPELTSLARASSSVRETLVEGVELLPGAKAQTEAAPSQEPTHAAPEVTLPLTTQHPLTVGATLVPDSDIAPSRGPEPQPSAPPGEEGPLASGAPGSGLLDRVAIQPLAEESSGSGSDDFTFPAPGEKSETPEGNNPEVTDGEALGASQGILDRKEVLGGVIAGGLVGLLFAIVLVGFMLYRMKKKDEGSYSLEEPKQANGGYQKPQRQEEFYA